MCEAAPPSTSTMPTWRWSRLVVLLEQPLQRDRRGRAVVEVGQGLALVGDVGVRLGGDGADPGHRGRYGGPDGEELRRHGHAPRLSVGGPGHDRERHGPHDSEPHARPPRPILACPQPRLRSHNRRVLHRLGFPSVGRHRRFVTAIAIDAVGSGVFMPISMLYFLVATDLTLVQVGAAISLASLIALPAGPLIGSVVDRIGAKQVLLAGNAAPGRRLRGLPVLRLVRRGDGLDGRGDRRPDRVLGLLRQHRRRDLGAGGAGEVVRLPGCAAQRRVRGRRAGLRRRRSRSARRRRTPRSWSSTPRRTPWRSCCCSRCPATERGEHERSRARGRPCCATAPTACCGARSWRSRCR